MKRINILSEDTANKIAAGEVVERPSSVVKELVENSIDANAKNILIEVEEGGISLMRVIDDGDGIYKDDMTKAFLPHATSKIKESEDIYNISTLGFRGEALPSIASVSKVNLKSKQEESGFGYEISIEGGGISDVTECGINKGTIIEVRDLFYNVPARKKFLKTISKEGSLINDIVTRIALANPDVSIKLYNNGKKIIHTFGNGDIKDVIRTIYGRNISEDIIYFEDTSDLVTIHGYVGREDIARGSRNNQSTFVNKRYIKNKSLAVAVEQAFKSFSTVNKFPFFILYIEIYPEYVDVNIHPTKAEIKFNDERMIFGKIFNAVHTALKNDVFDDFAIKEEEETFKETSKIPSFEEIAFKIKEEEVKVKIASNIAKEVMDGGKILNVNLSSEKPKEEINIPVDLKTNSESYASAQFPVETTFHEKYDLKNDIISEEYTTIDLKKEENIYSEEPKNINNVSNSTNNEVKSAKFPPITIIGQYNKTYILGEKENVKKVENLKILFEKYLKEIENGDIVIQPLMVPTIIDLTIDDYSYYEENIKVFKEAGFVLEEFGGTSLALKEVPYFLGRLNAKKLFLEILDNLKNLGNGKTSEVKHNAIATKACKAAVKGNDKLEFNEMIKLVEELRYIDDPFHCPHGRPVIVKFTSTDIDKKFRRIV